MDLERAIQQEMDETGLDYETARQIVEQRHRPSTGNGHWARPMASDLATLAPSQFSREDLWAMYQRAKSSTSTPSPQLPSPPLANGGKRAASQLDDPAFLEACRRYYEGEEPPPMPSPAPAHTHPRPRHEPPAPPANCAGCHDSGYVVADVRIGDPAFGQLIPCPACAPKRQQERTKRERQRRVAELLPKLQVDLGDLAQCTFDRFDSAGAGAAWTATLTGIKAICADYAAAPEGWLYLWGGCGAGKSHLAAAIAQVTTGHGLPTSYAYAPDLDAFVRDGFGDNSATSRLDALKAVEVLILDDVGTGYARAWEGRMLTTLIDARYRTGRPTIITSNYALDQLPRQFEDVMCGKRIASRIEGQAQVVDLSAIPDYRRRR